MSAGPVRTAGSVNDLTHAVPRGIRTAGVLRIAGAGHVARYIRPRWHAPAMRWEPLLPLRADMTVLEALAAEYALPPPAVLAVIFARVLTAAILGGMVGYERERKGRAAGLKTHVLVSIGSALFVLAPAVAGTSLADLTRVMQGIVSGIGFLGAGAIIKLERDARIEGLTTAAGIWMTCAIGMAVGMGMEMVALATTLVALIVVNVVPRVFPATQQSGSGGGSDS